MARSVIWSIQCCNLRISVQYTDTKTRLSGVVGKGGKSSAPRHEKRQKMFANQTNVHISDPLWLTVKADFVDNFEFSWP